MIRNKTRQTSKEETKIEQNKIFFLGGVRAVVRHSW